MDQLHTQLIKVTKEDLICLYIQVVRPQIGLLKFKSNSDTGLADRSKERERTYIILYIFSNFWNDTTVCHSNPELPGCHKNTQDRLDHHLHDQTHSTSRYQFLLAELSAPCLTVRGVASPSAR